MGKKLQVEILGDASSLSKSFRQASSEGSRFGEAMDSTKEHFSRLGEVVRDVGGAFLGVGAGVSIIEGFKGAVEAMHSLDLANAATENALRATHDVSGQTADGINKYADQLQNLTGVNRVAIQGSENLLLAFTNVRGQGFQRATKDALDLSTAMGIGLTSATKMVGKALQDPAHGFTALQRAGVVFSQSQKETIKKLEETGHSAQAQDMIFAGLEGRFKGAAAAAGDTLPGQINILKGRLNDLGVELADKLVPAFSSAVGWINDHWPQISQVIGRVAEQVGAAYATYIRPAIGFLITEGQQAVQWVQANWPQISAVAERVFGDIKQVITTTVAIAEGLWQRFGDVILSQARATWEFVRGTIQNALTVIRGIIDVVTGLIHGDWSQVWQGIKEITSGIFSQIGNVISFAGRTLANLMTVAGRLASAAFHAALDAAIGLAQDVLDGVMSILASLAGKARDQFAKLGNAITGFAKEALGDAVQVGEAIVQGIEQGITSLAGGIADKLKGAVGGAISAVKGAFGIHSPSQTTHDEIGVPLGQGVIEGWVLGSASLPSKMSQALQTAIETARQQVSGARSVFQSAFSDLASVAQQAFSAIASATQTEAGKKLAAMQAADLKQQLQQAVAAAKSAIADAKTQLATDQATPDSDPLAQAAKIKQDGQSVLAAQQQLVAAQRAIREQDLTDKAASEQKQLNASNAVRSMNFQKALQQLQTNLSKEGATTGEATSSILKLLGTYGVNFKSVGADMGAAWIQGIKETIAAAASKSGALSGAISSAAASISVPKRAGGGPVSAGAAYMVGELGPELFVPGQTGSIVPNHALAGGGGGAPMVNVTVNGYVGDEQQLASRIRTALVGLGRIDGGGLLGGYA